MWESIFTSWLGQAGTIFIIAQVVDVIEKRMGKKGIFEDLANLAEKTGAGIGKMISGIIPGSKVEPELAEFFEHLENAEDAISNAILDQLKKETQNSEDEK